MAIRREDLSPLELKEFDKLSPLEQELYERSTDAFTEAAKREISDMYDKIIREMHDTLVFGAPIEKTENNDSK